MSDQDYRESLSLDVSNFPGGLQAAQVALGTFASALAEKALEAVVGFSLEIVNMAREVGKSVEALENLSAATGVSEKNLTTLESLAKVSGASMEGLASVMRILSRNMQEADSGNVEMQQKLKLLGITSRDAWTALLQVSDTLTRYDADTKRLAISTEVMGRGFAQILPAIKDGSKAFKEAEDRAVYLGTAFDYFNDGKIKTMDDAFGKLGLAIEGFWKNLVGAVSPVITVIVEGITELVVMTSELMGQLSFNDAIMAQWIRFSTLLKEIGVNAMGVLSGQVFSVAGRDAMRKEIDAIESEAKARLMQLKRDSFTPEPEAAKKGSIGDPTNIAQQVKDNEASLKLREAYAADVAKINKAASDVDLALLASDMNQHRMSYAQGAQEAAEIQQSETQDLITSLTSRLSALSAFHQRRLALGFGTTKELETYEKEYAINTLKVVTDLEAARLKLQQEGITGRIKIREASQKDDKIELDDAVKLSEAKVTVAQTELASYSELARANLRVLQSQRALAIQEAETQGRDTTAIRMKYDALIDQENQRATSGFTRGWKEAMATYTNQTASTFNLAVDMVRGMATQMQSAFSTIFMDFFDKKITSIKDALASLGDFVKKVVSDILARLAAVIAMKAVAAGLSGGSSMIAGWFAGNGTMANNFNNFGVGAHEGGQVVRRYSFGGPVLSNGDSVPALLTPGEFVVSRQGVNALNRLNQGQASSMAGGQGDVTVNIVGSGQDQKPTVNVQRQFGAMVVDVIWANVRQNGSLRQLFQH